MHFLSKEPQNSTSVAGFKSAFCSGRTKNVEARDFIADFAPRCCEKTTVCRDNAPLPFEQACPCPVYSSYMRIRRRMRPASIGK
jgi:hypothetical protein